MSNDVIARVHKNWWVMDSCLRRNDTYERKIPFLVIPVKTGIHLLKQHKMAI